MFDDASALPLDIGPDRRLTMCIWPEVLRADSRQGTAAGKNTIARRAHAVPAQPDDDAFLGAPAVREDEAAARSGLARWRSQSDEHGRRFPAARPAAAERPCYVPAFIGFVPDRKRAALEIGAIARRSDPWRGTGGLPAMPGPGSTSCNCPMPLWLTSRTLPAGIRAAVRSDAQRLPGALYNEPLGASSASFPYKLELHADARLPPVGTRWPAMTARAGQVGAGDPRQRHPCGGGRCGNGASAFSPPYTGGARRANWRVPACPGSRR